MALRERALHLGASKTATENHRIPGKTSKQHEQFKRLHMCAVARAARAKVDEDATVVLAGDINQKTECVKLAIDADPNVMATFRDVGHPPSPTEKPDDRDWVFTNGSGVRISKDAPSLVAWDKQHAAVISEVAGVSPAASQGADRVPSAADQLVPGGRRRMEALRGKMRARRESTRMIEENLLKQAARSDAESTAPTAKRPRHEAPSICFELFVSQRKSFRAQGIKV